MHVCLDYRPALHEGIVDGEYRSTWNQHTERVARLTHALANQLGVSPADRFAVLRADAIAPDGENRRDTVVSIVLAEDGTYASTVSAWSDLVCPVATFSTAPLFTSPSRNR